MSETIGQPESATESTQAVIDRAVWWIEKTEKYLEQDQTARDEAIVYYEKFVKESLENQEVIFSGPIEQGKVPDKNGLSWTKRIDTFDNQAALVEDVSVNIDQSGDIQTTAILRLIGGDKPDWEVAVLLEKVDWNLMEEQE